MSDYYMQKFDMKALLKFGDFDIRGVAAKNELLPAEEYIGKLSQFLGTMPVITIGLNQIANFAVDEKVLQSLADARELLTDIGAHKLVDGIDGILEAERKGNETFAADWAKNMATDFSELYMRTMDAQKPPKTGAVSADTNNPSDKSNNNPTLKEVLEGLDYEEDNRKLRILAIDDAPFMLKTISSVLSNDYEVFLLANPVLVEKFLQHTTPELFLLDYTMPEINGFELIPIIRSFKEHKDTPIVFLTAMATVHHISEATALGACDFVAKPLNAEILCQKIEKHIVRKRSF